MAQAPQSQMENPSIMTTEAKNRIEVLATSFLQESVFASREASHTFSPRAVEGASGCGLGLRPTIPEDFNDRQASLLEQMIEAAGLPPEQVRYDAIRDCVTGWIKMQDGIDRQRNHFLKDFRGVHGFDRKAYAPQIETAFQEGLRAINDDNRARLQAQASALASTFARA